MPLAGWSQLAWTTALVPIDKHDPVPETTKLEHVSLR